VEDSFVAERVGEKVEVGIVAAENSAAVWTGAAGE
jgi:hypothetical protein